MATIHEFACGCMVHELAGTIRKCAGATSRSLSGRMVAKGDGGEQKHNHAMQQNPVKVYNVANILP